MTELEILEALDEAKTAVKVLSGYYSGLWVPCKNDAPTPETYYSGTDDIDVIEGVRNDNYKSHRVIVTVLCEGEYFVEIGYYGKTVPATGHRGIERSCWMNEYFEEYTVSKVVAWMPFPSPCTNYN